MSLLGARGPQGHLAPVVFETGLVESDEKIDRNIRSCLAKRYQSFASLCADPWRGSCSIFGSSPSIDWTWPYAKGHIIACNAAHDFLIKNRTIPQYAMLWDPVEVLNDFITPHDQVTYLLASRCHPNIFKRFEGKKFVVWHADGDTNIKSILEQNHRMEPIIFGGSTAVTRSMFLAVAMGYLDLHVFGIDSSTEGGSHIRKSVVKEDYMEIFCDGRWFETTPWLAVQAEDFKKIAPYLIAAGVNLTIYGDGLIPHIAKGMGLRVIDSKLNKEVAFA